MVIGGEVVPANVISKSFQLWNPLALAMGRNHWLS